VSFGSASHAKDAAPWWRSRDGGPHFAPNELRLGTREAGAEVVDHNIGRCPHTASRRPWRRHVVIEFTDEPIAIRFERYLKSGSGRAFAKHHFEG
jgi:putative endonuclease